MGFCLQTERLTLRDYGPNDYAILREIYLDSALARFHLSGQDDEAYVRYSFEHGQWQTRLSPRMAYDLALVNAARETVGFCGLKRSLDPDCGNLNWDIHPTHWKQGYATESAARLIEFGFAELELKQITASSFADNLASIRVMEKVGLLPYHNGSITSWWRGLTVGEERPVLRYQLTHEQWLASRAKFTTSQPLYQFAASAN